MRKKYFIIIFIILISWNKIYSQTGSDIIICLDNSSSISNTAFNEMTISTRKIIESVLKCNSNNKVSVIHYGTNLYNQPYTNFDTPKIYIDFDFTNNLTTALSFSSTKKLNHGDHFHEALGLIGNALSNVPNANILSPQTTLSTNPARQLIIFLFTDASRSSGNLSLGSYLVNYNSPFPIGNNNAILNFIDFKNNRNAKFVVVHVNNNSENIEAAAAISSPGGAYNGPIEVFIANPDHGIFPRSYFNKSNFILTNSEISSVVDNICLISGGNINFHFERRECMEIGYPLYLQGNYTIPSGTSLVNIQAALKSNTTGTVYPINTPPSFPSPNQFEFLINQADFTNPLGGSYNFIVTLTYTDGTSTQNIVAINSTIGEPYDIKFCCSDNLVITNEILAPNTDYQSASNSIIASNIINNGASAIYHAGSFVSLETGFYAKAGSEFHAYIEGCDPPIIYNKINNNNNPFIQDEDPNNVKNLLKENNAQKTIQISQNPNNGEFKIYFDNIKSGSVQIIDLYGKIVHEKSFKNDKSVDIKIKNLPPSTYVVKIISEKEIITKQIIKI